MADPKTYAQWTQSGSGLSLGIGRLVADGDGYTIETTGQADAAFVTDGDGVSIDTTTTTGRHVAMVHGKAEVV